MEKRNLIHSASVNNYFIVLRIVGNELRPRDATGSKLRSLHYILKNEPMNMCNQLWVINHIINAHYKEKVKSLLKKFHQAYEELEFSTDIYLSLDSWEKKIKYAININAARNQGIKLCQKSHHFVICLDQDCYFTKDLLQSVLKNIAADQYINRRRKYYSVLMKRIVNENLVGFELLPNEEPHLIFRHDARQYFDEDLMFGKNDKVALLKKMGFTSSPVDFTLTGERCKNVGFVLHHSYGNQLSERDTILRNELRKISVMKFINALEKACVHSKLDH